MTQTKPGGGWTAVAIGTALMTPWLIGGWLADGPEREFGQPPELLVRTCGEPSQSPVFDAAPPRTLMIEDATELRPFHEHVPTWLVGRPHSRTPGNE